MINTFQEITAALPNLSTDELQHLEEAIHNLYRNRDTHIIYDDGYGVWTEQDQNSAAAVVFRMFDKEEELKENANS